MDDEKSTVSSSSEEGSDHISNDHKITEAKKAKLDVECISVHSVSSIENILSSDASEMEYDVAVNEEHDSSGITRYSCKDILTSFTSRL